MKKAILIYVILSLLSLYCIPLNASLDKRKKKNVRTEQKAGEVKSPVRKTSPYARLFKGKDHVKAAGGFMTVHKVGNKVYLEVPLNILGREMLIASTPSETSDNMVATNGFKSMPPLHVCFMLQDSMVHMRGINAKISYRPEDRRQCAVVGQNFLNPTLEVYPVLAYNEDRTAVVFDMTSMFTGGNEKVAPVSKGNFPLLFKPVLNKSLSRIEGIKAFEDNISVKSSLSYKVSARMGKKILFEDKPVSVMATWSILLLPEEKMHPRVSDSRIGIFLTMKQQLPEGTGNFRNYSLANRWRLEPVDEAAYRRGEMVEVRKNVVFYLDSLFPETWKPAIRRGLTRWNRAFEKIGFKNVVEVRDFPVDDPDFDPDNLKYNCVRYVPSMTQNAMGPSWVDPATGEILNASIMVYSGVAKMLQTWNFVQTAQLDTSVRHKEMPLKVFQEALAYVTAHEMGHCLGLMHNMGASNTFPVDSLRSPSFTHRYGTTPSIMDYARFNYVAQPGDKGVKLTPPDLGVYDEFAIGWLYTPVYDASDAEEEAEILESWIDSRAGEPFLHYGKQQVKSRYDPRALEEDLGDDAVKAGNYGIRNLKYILAHLNEWTDGDEDASFRQELYDQISVQYARYIQNVIYCIGGIYLNDVKEGGPEKRYMAVPRRKQKEAMQWVMAQLREIEWIDRPEVCSKFGLQMKKSALLSEAISNALVKLCGNVSLSAFLAGKDAYTVAEFFDDYYKGAWDAVIRNRRLTVSDKQLQKAMLDIMSGSVARIGGRKFPTTLVSVNAYRPSIDEICWYGLDPTGLVRKYACELKACRKEMPEAPVLDEDVAFGQGYGIQKTVSTQVIDETATYCHDMAVKIEKLLSRKLETVHPADKAHCRAMLYAVRKMLNS